MIEHHSSSSCWSVFIGDQYDGARSAGCTYTLTLRIPPLFPGTYHHDVKEIWVRARARLQSESESESESEFRLGSKEFERSSVNQSKPVSPSKDRSGTKLFFFYDYASISPPTDKDQELQARKQSRCSINLRAHTYRVTVL